MFFPCQSCGAARAVNYGACGHAYCESCSCVIAQFTQQCPACDAECLRMEAFRDEAPASEMPSIRQRSAQDAVMCAAHPDTPCSEFCHECQAFFCPRCRRHGALRHLVSRIELEYACAWSPKKGLEVNLLTQSGRITALTPSGVLTKKLDGAPRYSQTVAPIRLGEAQQFMTVETLVDGLLEKDLEVLQEILQTEDIAVALRSRRARLQRGNEQKDISAAFQVCFDQEEGHFLEMGLAVEEDVMLSAAGIRRLQRKQAPRFASVGAQKLQENMDYGALCRTSSSAALHVVLDKVQRHVLICPIELEQEKGVNLHLASWEATKSLQQVELGGEPVGICADLFQLVKSCQPDITEKIGRVCHVSMQTTALQRCTDVSVCLANRLNAVRLADKAAALVGLFYGNCASGSSGSHEPVTLENYRHGKFVVRNKKNWKYGSQDVSPRYCIVDGQKYHPGRLFGFSMNPSVVAVQWLGGAINVYSPGEVCYFPRFEELYYAGNRLYASPVASGRDLLSRTRFCACWCGISVASDVVGSCKASGGVDEQQPAFQQVLLANADQFILAKSKVRMASAKASACVLGNAVHLQSGLSVAQMVLKEQSVQTVKTAYKSALLSFQEQYQPRGVPAEIQKILKKSPLPFYAGPPVVASGERAHLPAVVTIGEDWHHGTQWTGNLGEEKIGIMVPNKAYQQGDQVCVMWASQLRADIHRLYERAQLIVQQIQKNTFGQLAPLLSSPALAKEAENCYVYDAGRDRLFELCYYDRRVSTADFRQFALVGPGVEFVGEPQIMGVLLFQQGGWALVYWMSGTINRHRIGASGRYELSYASGY